MRRDQLLQGTGGLGSQMCLDKGTIEWFDPQSGAWPHSWQPWEQHESTNSSPVISSWATWVPSGLKVLASSSQFYLLHCCPHTPIYRNSRPGLSHILRPEFQYGHRLATLGTATAHWDHVTSKSTCLSKALLLQNIQNNSVQPHLCCCHYRQ